MTLSEEINRMIQTALENAEFTSANPVHINRLIQINAIENPDLESLIQTEGPLDTPEGVKGKSTGALDSISKEKADEILKAAGVDPGQLLALTRGQGIGALAGRGAGALGFAGPAGIALMVATLLPQLMEEVVKELQKPGGFMDKRVKIEAEKELFAGLDRQTRQKTRIGDRQVIIQQVEGFRTDDGTLSTNTSDLIRENAGRVRDIGLFDRAAGVR